MFTKDTPIIQVLRALPQAKAIFVKHGMGCIGCMGSNTETIENGARIHEIDVDSLLGELNTAQSFEKNYH